MKTTLIHLANPSFFRSFNRNLCFFISFFFFIVFLLKPEIANAASGGRIGGSNFQAPSMPRSGGYRGGYGGYGGGYGGGSYRGGGIGFPFLFPLFGIGGGGLFGFLILMAITGVIVNSIKGVASNSRIKSSGLVNGSEPITMVQLQLGLLSSAKDIQTDLRSLAFSADTKTSLGLQNVLQETTLSLLRQPDLWVYANLEIGKVPFNSAEATFNRLSINERSKLKTETTSNFSGKINSSPGEELISEGLQKNEYIAVTILVAYKEQLNLSQKVSNEEIAKTLKIMGSIPSSSLMALEVIWQPEGSGEVLSSDELIRLFPNLKYL